MIIKLNNGKTVALDIDAALPNSEAEAIKWLRQYKERKNEDLLLQAHGDALRSQFEETQGADHAL